jgi:hypothetical protein
MTCEFVFLPVGNADSIIIYPDGGSAVVIDLHKIPLLLKWFQNKKETNISRIYITHEHNDHFPSLDGLVSFLETWLKTGTIGSICLPYEVYKKARKKVADGKGNELLKDALLRLRYWEKNNIIKIVLAILFFLCLADMPYGFYQFVRFVGLIGFTILAYQANQQGRQTEMIIYSGLALLFQPFFKIALGRQMWNIVDVVVGIGLLISIFMKPKESQP